MSGERAPAAGRLEWVDAARGIGILAVVVGHVWNRGLPHSMAYSFHMPLFFLLSGWLFQPRPVVRFARRLLVGQGISYVAFLVLLVALDTLIEGSRGHRGIFHNWPADLGRLAYGGSALRGPFTVFWFVPCLVFARIILNTLAARFPDPLGRVWMALAAASLLLAYGLGRMTDASPLGLLSVPMALFLLWAGAVCARFPLPDRTLWLLLPLSLAGLFLFPPVNMKAGDYGWPVASIAGAIATSLLVFRIGRVGSAAMAPLRILGRGSLVIMYLHVPVIHYLSHLGRPALLVLATILPLAVYYLFDTNRWTRTLFLGGK